MHATSFLPGLSPVAGKSLTTARDAGNLSSNGGAVVLREAAHRLGLAQSIAGPLPDTRNPLLVTHTYADMVMARMVATACGYEDADDLDSRKPTLPPSRSNLISLPLTLIDILDEAANTLGLHSTYIIRRSMMRDVKFKLREELTRMKQRQPATKRG
jgi:Transposase DDE domain group 1